MDHLVCFTGMVKPEKQSKNEVMDSWVLDLCDAAVGSHSALWDFACCWSVQVTYLPKQKGSTLKGYYVTRFKCNGHFVPMNSNFFVSCFL